MRGVKCRFSHATVIPGESSQVLGSGAQVRQGGAHEGEGRGKHVGPNPNPADVPIVIPLPRPKGSVSGGGSGRGAKCFVGGGGGCGASEWPTPKFLGSERKFFRSGSGKSLQVESTGGISSKVGLTEKNVVDTPQYRMVKPVQKRKFLIVKVQKRKFLIIPKKVK